MKWTIVCGDILQQPADVLICSANVFLSLGGGVGGAIMARCGDGMQRELEDYLKTRGRRTLEPGEVVKTAAFGLPFGAVLHAVAMDERYQSTPQIVGGVAARSLSTAQDLGARRMAMSALGTGQGRLSMKQFAEGISPLLETEFPPIVEVMICVREKSQRDELAAAMKL